MDDDVELLLQQLTDDSFVVREAAAWRLSDLGETPAIPQLLEALDRGYREGLDNDGLAVAITDLAELHPARAQREVARILEQGPESLRQHASWLREFCRGHSR